MSIPAFSQLSSDEIAQLTYAPAQIAILIAGADQKVDKQETEWAAKLVHYRSFSSEPLLFGYYELVETDFESQVMKLADAYRNQPEKLVPEISADMTKLNAVLEKVEDDYAEALRKSWRSLAKKVAEASGGLWGFATINAEEKRLIDLPMIEG